jgi:hypothetical protein
MIRPHPDPFTVSNLRHHRRKRTLAVMLALVGTVACGSENTTGPRSPELAGSAKQWTVPTGGSLMLQSEADAARAAIENSRKGVNDMNWQSYAGNPEIASRDQWFPAPSGVRPPTPLNILSPAFSEDHHSPVIPDRLRGAIRGGGKGGRPPTPRALWAVGDCPIGQVCYTEDPCTDYRNEIRRLGADYARAYTEFWENMAVPWKVFSNWWVGGPVDVMRTKFREMYFVHLAYKGRGCGGRPPRGGWGAPA